MYLFLSEIELPQCKTPSFWSPSQYHTGRIQPQTSIATISTEVPVTKRIKIELRIETMQVVQREV